MNQPANSAISLKDVRKVYPRPGAQPVVALDGINLEIPAGDIHGIVGESGAGKSTLIRCLTALETPTSGSVTVAGQDLTKLSAGKLRKARRSIGMVFQAANLLDSRTAAGNIAYPLYLAGVARGARHQRVSELLELVGLDGRGGAYPSQLSGGQRQRVGIARALADEPSVLLCDEPTSALDSETTTQILELIRELNRRLGVTVLIITHEMDVVRKICDSVTLLENGKIVQSGRLDEVLKDGSSALSQELISAPAVDPTLVRDGHVLIDTYFTSTPGKPTGSSVMGLAASMGADVAAGTFESIGKIQVGRLALTIPAEAGSTLVAKLRDAGVQAKEREL